MSVATMLCAVASTFHMLLFYRAMQGFLMPGVTAVAVAFIGVSFSEADLGPKVGGWIAASVAGGLTGRVLSGFLAAGINWRAPFVFFGLFTVIGAAVIARSLPRREGNPTGRLSDAYRGMFAHFRNRRLVGAFLIGCAVFFCFVGVFTSLPYYLTAPPFHLSTAVVSSVYLVYIAGVFTSVISGRLSGRGCRRSVMAAGLAIACLGGLGPLVHSLPLVVLSLCVLCIGLFTLQSTAPPFVNPDAVWSKRDWGAS